MHKKKSPVPASEKAGTERMFDKRTLVSEHINLTRTLEIKITQAERGEFVVMLPQKTLLCPTLETLVSEIRSVFKQGGNENKPDESCPHCGSNNTIGHGLREAHRQVFTRRICNSCNKTFISNKEPKLPSTKEQVAFLKLLEYTDREIADFVHRSILTVREHTEHIETAAYPKKQAEANQVHIIVAEKSEVKPEAIAEAQSNTILAPEFDRAQAIRERIGNFTVWNYNGRLAASAKGKPAVIYLAKESILHMKMLRKQEKSAFYEYILQLPEGQRQVVGDLIETMIDEDLGMFPMVRLETRVGDSGELDAGILEDGGYIDTGGGEV